MPLTWDITACDPAIRDTEEERVVTERLIFYSLPLGYGSITEKNAADVYAAIHVFEVLVGNSRRPRTTPQDVRRRIGLVTNAKTEKSPAAHITRIAKDMLREARSTYLNT